MNCTIEKFQENLRYVLNSFENIMENGAFALKKANAPFSIIFANTRYFTGVKRRYYVFNSYENIMENGAFAPKEQMLHFA